MFLPQYEKSSLTPIPNNKKNYVSVYLSNKVVVQFPFFTQISVDNLFLVKAVRYFGTLQIRRGVGPLTIMKKVGPELSKKICTFFTASDGKATLSQE